MKPSQLQAVFAPIHQFPRAREHRYTISQVMQAYSRRPRSPRPALQLPSGRLVRITADNFIIGSGAGCNLPLQDSSVAERHLIVQRAGDHWQAAVLSLDATALVNKEPLQGIVRLQQGDVLQVGRTRLRYVEDDAAVGMAGLLWSRMWLLALLLVAVLVMAALALAALEREQAPAETAPIVSSPSVPATVVATPPPAATPIPPTATSPAETPTPQQIIAPTTSPPPTSDDTATPEIRPPRSCHRPPPPHSWRQSPAARCPMAGRS